MRGRLVSRALVIRASATLAGAVTGAVALSGSGQPVTAHPYPRWQGLPPPPFAARVHALGVHVGPLVLVLGGRDASGSCLRDGASYDVRTGRWHHLSVPIGLSDRDDAVSAAGIVVVRHATSWWRYDARRDVWARLHGLPPRLAAPSSFHSEVYAVSARRRVVVYSTQLGRWSRLPADRLRPTLSARSVRASRHGTVTAGYAAGRYVADRWDGVRWHREASPPAPVTDAAAGTIAATRLDVGGRVFVARGDRAWIRLP